MLNTVPADTVIADAVPVALVLLFSLRTLGRSTQARRHALEPLERSNPMRRAKAGRRYAWRRCRRMASDWTQHTEGDASLHTPSSTQSGWLHAQGLITSPPDKLFDRATDPTMLGGQFQTEFWRMQVWPCYCGMLLYSISIQFAGSIGPFARRFRLK